MHLDKRVGKADELRVGVEVLGGRHGDELDGALVTELRGAAARVSTVVTAGRLAVALAGSTRENARTTPDPRELLSLGEAQCLQGVWAESEADLHVRQLAHGKDRLGSSHAVVGDQDLADRKVAAALFHKLGYSVINLDLALRSGDHVHCSRRSKIRSGFHPVSGRVIREGCHCRTRGVRNTEPQVMHYVALCRQLR